MGTLELGATLKNLLGPIPVLKRVDNWKNIPIEECGENLVQLNNLDPNLVMVDPQYYKRGIQHSTQIMCAREGVAKKLLIAGSQLPKGLKLLILDAWRPLEVQQALFDDYVTNLEKTLTEPREKLIEIAQTYVSLPSSDISKPSPHFTGGAVDLTLCDTQGKQLDMGTAFDFFGPEAGTRYYEGQGLDSTASLNRRVLYNSMVAAGFSAYDEEWWHFDFGNQFDTVRTSKQFAIYGCPNEIPG
jgi:D-alanyl-D-alanine dipeptidase